LETYLLLNVHTLATEAGSGGKKSKDRITLALTTNADGSEKLEPWVIGNNDDDIMASVVDMYSADEENEVSEPEEDDIEALKISIRGHFKLLRFLNYIQFNRTTLIQ
jgi:hypothetical protein